MKTVAALLFFLSSFGLLEAVAAAPSFQIDNGYVEKPGTKKEVSNMPRVKSQGVIPIGYGMSAAAIAQRHICRSKGIKDCANFKEFERNSKISPLGMVVGSKLTSAVEPVSFSNYRGLDFGSTTSTYRILAAASDFSFLPQDSCFDFDSFARKYGARASTSQQIEDKEIEWNFAYAELKYVFEKNKKAGLPLNKTGNGSSNRCVDCELVNRNLLTKINKARLATALERDTFPEFLHSLVFQGCSRVSSKPPVFKFFPSLEESADKHTVLATIMAVIGNNFPVAIDGICIARDATGICVREHAVVISGHKQICKKSDCRISLKVHDSRGANRESENNTGWVDADSVLQDIDYEKPGILAWYE